MNGPTKPIVCFPGKGPFAIGAAAYQHRELGPIVMMSLGQHPGAAAAGDRLTRLPAAQAIEFALLLEETARRALAGESD